MQDNNVKIRYKLDYTQNIRLSDLSHSLLAFDQQYNRHLKRHRGEITDNKVKLYVEEITKGSIDAWIVPAFSYSLMFPDSAQSIWGFISNLATFLDFLKGTIAQPAFHFEKADLEHAKYIVKPVAKDYSSQLNLYAYDGANVEVHYHVGATDAIAINDKANQLIKNLELPEKTTLPDQLLTFRMTEDTLTRKANKGVIEAISDDLLPVYTDNESIKEAILDNPYRKIFLVDVEVNVVDGVPKMYKIVDLKETFDKD